MKQIHLSLLGVVCLAGSAFSQLTVNSVVERFPGSYDGNWGVSAYTYNNLANNASSSDTRLNLLGSERINHWQSFAIESSTYNPQINGNGTTTGSSVFAYRKTGSSGTSATSVFAVTPDILGLTLNTPDATTYTSIFTLTGFPKYDSRYSLSYLFSTNPYFLDYRVVVDHKNVTLKVKNNSAVDGYVLIEIQRSNLNSAPPSSYTQGSTNTRQEFSVLANSTQYITYANFPGNSSITGLSFRFSGFGVDGQIELDDLTLGLELPSSLVVTATGSVNTLLGGNSLQLGGIINTGDAFFQTDNLVTYSLQSSHTNVATISGTGLLTTSPDILVGVNPVVTITAASVYNISAVGRYVLTIVGSSSVYVSVTGLSISGPTTVSSMGSLSLTPTINPANASNQALTWSSSNINIATVDVSNGVVVGVSPGVVTITATSVDNSAVTATYVVSVLAAPFPATFTGTRLKETFDADWSGNYYFPNPNWPFVANTSSYISNGGTNGLTIGRFAYYSSGASGIDAGNIYGNMGGGAYRINVNTPMPFLYGNTNDVISHAGVLFDSRYFIPYTFGQQGNFNLGAGGMDISANPNFTIELTNLTSTTGYVLFDFFNNSDRFNVTGPAHRYGVALAPGLNRVRFRLDGSNTNIRGFLLRTSNMVGGLNIDNLRVGFPLPTDISLQVQSNPLIANSTVQFAATLSPLGVDAEYPEVNWSVSPSNLATITGNGLLYIGGINGLVVVRAASPWSGSVFVEQLFTITGGFTPVTGLSIYGPSILTVTSATTPTTYTAQVSPYNASNSDVSWTLAGTGATLTSSDVASAQVTPNAEGVVTLTAVSLSNGAVVAHKVITIAPSIVTIPVSGITISGLTTVTVGGTASYTVAIEPSSATDLTVIWSVTPLELATISGDGVLSALGKGIVTITAASVATSSVVGVLLVEIVEEAVSYISNGASSLGVLVYPNPATDALYIFGAEVDSKVYIFDMLGNEVLNVKVTPSINIGLIPSGVYQVLVKSSNGIKRATFVKQ